MMGKGFFAGLKMTGVKWLRMTGGVDHWTFQATCGK